MFSNEFLFHISEIYVYGHGDGYSCVLLLSNLLMPEEASYFLKNMMLIWLTNSDKLYSSFAHKKRK